MRIGFIGGGVMGEAIIKGILAKKVVKPTAITVSDISKQRLATLKERYGVTTTNKNEQAAQSSDVIILAIKPSEMDTVLPQLRPLSSKQLVISIAAGVTLATLKKGLRHNRLIRSIPNMPGQIGEGISVWTATPEVTQKQKDTATAILASLGEEIYVASEKYIDMATAVSGSGPGYIFLIAEALTDAGVHIGLPRTVAEKLVIETLIGSGRSIKMLGEHPASLRNKVTSPGGTTTEGLLELETGGLRSLLLHAVIAAYEKSLSLGSK
ncbi:MAG TPA: pyrroline-5-carboxylate reductase [Dehalococcoidia bacterium]|nr:pyrroline-5-carboxylate reductase [Dehalococcoidia bacterium]